MGSRRTQAAEEEAGKRRARAVVSSSVHPFPLPLHVTRLPHPAPFVPQAAHPDKPAPPVTALAQVRTDVSVIPTSTGEKVLLLHGLCLPGCLNGTVPALALGFPLSSVQAIEYSIPAKFCLQATSWLCTAPCSWTSEWWHSRRPSLLIMVSVWPCWKLFAQRFGWHDRMWRWPPPSPLITVSALLCSPGLGKAGLGEAAGRWAMGDAR